MSMIYQIKKARLKDIDRILLVLERVIGWSISSYIIRDFINNDGCYVIFNRNKNIIGFICFDLYDSDMDIEYLGILKRYQGKGFGKAFIDFAIDIAITNEYNTITLGSLRKFNAKKFYLKMGFEVGENTDSKCYEFKMDLRKAKSKKQKTKNKKKSKVKRKINEEC